MTVFIPTPLRSYTGASTVEGRGATLGEVLEDLDARFPGLRFRVVDEQGVTRRHIKFFIGDAHNDDLSAPIPPGLPVHIVAALSGG